MILSFLIVTAVLVVSKYHYREESEAEVTGAGIADRAGVRGAERSMAVTDP